jgi:hypothetical protein
VTLFVIVYDRPQQRIIKIEEFREDQQLDADEYRLRMQRQTLDESLDRDIVLLRADSIDTLKKTHGSYFLSGEQFADRARESAP